jgi:uncharacterized membrane protein YGL010W
MDEAKADGMVVRRVLLLGNSMAGKMDETMVEQLVDVRVNCWIVPWVQQSVGLMVEKKAMKMVELMDELLVVKKVAW